MSKSKRKACDVSRVDPQTLWDMFHEQFPAEDDGEHIVNPYQFDCLGPKFQTDFSKVDFDFENFDYHTHSRKVGFGESIDILGKNYFWTSPYKHMSTGFSFIGCSAGGDWEYPVIFIVYLDQDGKTFRAYIPKEGNAWNYDIKCAIGSDEDADSAFLTEWTKKNRPDLVDDTWKPSVRFGITSVQYDVSDAAIMVDFQKIAEGMMNRFEAIK